MEKLLKLVEKLRNEIVPESPISKMPKEAILRFMTDANLLQRMRTFHRKGPDAGIRSVITDDEAPRVGYPEVQTAEAGLSPRHADSKY